MILAFSEKRKKAIAWMMLGMIYFETVVPPVAMGAGRRYAPAVKEVATTAVGSYFTSSRRVVRETGSVAGLRPEKKAMGMPPKTEDLGGPTQPEMTAFTPVGADKMVDLFSGDFSYNIPLMDVGGYPIALGYNSGITMDQEASWVGLGWNINPGTITRNLRGLPDDFNGMDSVMKTAHVKDNKTWGATAGADLEIMGFKNPPKLPNGDSLNISLGLSGSLGLFYNTYRGYGIESSFGANISAGSKTTGKLTAGLSVTNNSQEGITLSPSLGYSYAAKNAEENGGFSGSLSTSLSYNTRSGMKALSFSGGINYYRGSDRIQKAQEDVAAKNSSASSAEPTVGGFPQIGTVMSSAITYAYPTFTPTINLPYTSKMMTFTAKVGWSEKVVHPSLFVSGYFTTQKIADEDTTMYLPAFGYMNFQNAGSNASALMDFNREREIAYRESPPVPAIAIPGYTYDVFTMSGEGTGGSFRPYRSDIGYVFDHYMKTHDQSDRYSGDVGFGDILHVGADLDYTRAYTETGPWKANNPLALTAAFTKSDRDYEAVYLKNPGETTVNPRTYYDALGGDDVVAPKLFQASKSSLITTTNLLTRYANGKKKGEVNLAGGNAIKGPRDKRSQVISYLTAGEASVVGLDKYIENYGVNKFTIQDCSMKPPMEEETSPHGIVVEYYARENFNKYLFSTNTDTVFNFWDRGAWSQKMLQPDENGKNGGLEHFSAKLYTRIKVPETRDYDLYVNGDDGIRVTLNDSLIHNSFYDHSVFTKNGKNDDSVYRVYLEAGKYYNLKIDYYNKTKYAQLYFHVTRNGSYINDGSVFYLPVNVDSFIMTHPDTTALVKEKRVNEFRRGNHISEIDVLNADGRRYVYGIPVYNLLQKEKTFAVDHNRGNVQEGTVAYNPVDATTGNTNGTDGYYQDEEMPAYAHSFLLTGVLSPDYVDVTGNGISDDDLGSAVKFKYTKTAGLYNTYNWRTPYVTAPLTAGYNEGLRSDTRDDKASYVYGEKELWYLNSIESKNMVATFLLEDRLDQIPMNEDGTKNASNHAAKRLKEIALYTKADFLKGDTTHPVKKVHFEYSYELCKGINKPVNDSGKLTLKSVWFEYNGNKKGKRNAYVFNYNNQNPNYNAKSFDRWGNFKDPLQNPGSSAQNLITNAEYPYSLQDSVKAALNAPAWTLDSIILPSGGRIKVTYEADDYGYVQNLRATAMMKIRGFSVAAPTTLSDLSNHLYDANENEYVAVSVPDAVSSKQDVYNKYLYGLNRDIYFRLNVKMPSDKFGSGYEMIPCYASLDPGNYGMIDAHTIWFKINGVDNKGNEPGTYSPLSKTAIQFLRNNLPSKAYPGSDVGDDLDGVAAVKMLYAMSQNVMEMFRNFDKMTRSRNAVQQIDTSRSVVRLAVPDYKKYGGGLRVKRIVIYDNWNAMTKQKESTYGTEYQYTTIKEINGVKQEISSGVAVYEPILGGEENPWHQPVEYEEQSAKLGPVTMGYIEKPFGESFFPGASVGYSTVRTHSIKTKNTRSANGFEETNFYTSYDFPIITDYSLLDPETKLVYRPKLSNFLKINAAHHLVMSQGFKVELNDMNGKVRSQATYAEGETDPDKALSKTTTYYKVDDQNATFKHLNNTVFAMDKTGHIDTVAQVGKELELMMDMREERSVTNGLNCEVNVDIFSFGIPPVLGIPSLYVIPTNEENIYRSVAATKVITRHGIVDSVVAVDKGSKVVTHNLLFDAETGSVILSDAQNEFGDPIYSFQYPAGWAYDGMAGAYRNIDVIIDHANIRDGKLVPATGMAKDTSYFASGDEILVYTHNVVAGDVCNPVLATFPGTDKIWAIDANALVKQSTPNLFFMKQDGKPYTGNDVTLKIIRSGRRNIAGTAGAVTMLANPLMRSAGGYQLKIDNNSKVISAAVTQYQQNWQVEDKKKSKVECANN